MVLTIIFGLFGTFLVMESVAWLAHKYLMHGLLWFLHKDHHKKDDGQVFEKNDFFFVLFATPAILLFLYGSIYGLVIPMAIAGGITLYGFCYFMVHDIFIHQRFKWFRDTNNLYLKAIRRAHKMHHKHLGKEHGECFGMLWVPFKYFREAYQYHKSQQEKSVKV